MTIPTITVNDENGNPIQVPAPMTYAYASADGMLVTSNYGWTGLTSVKQVQEWISLGNTPAPYVAPPAAPLSCTPYQIRAALTKQGLRAQVETAVAACTDQNIKDGWAYAQTFTENDPFISTIGADLGQTPAQIHALFVLAQTLSA